MQVVRKMFKKKADAIKFAKNKNKLARTNHWRVDYFSPVSGYSVTRHKR
jgi:hypothetical protein